MLGAQFCRKSKKSNFEYGLQVFFSNRMPKGTLWGKMAQGGPSAGSISVYVSE